MYCTMYMMLNGIGGNMRVVLDAKKVFHSFGSFHLYVVVFVYSFRANRVEKIIGIEITAMAKVSLLNPKKRKNIEPMFTVILTYYCVSNNDKHIAVVYNVRSFTETMEKYTGITTLNQFNDSG